MSDTSPPLFDWVAKFPELAERPAIEGFTVDSIQTKLFEQLYTIEEHSNGSLTFSYSVLDVPFAKSISTSSKEQILNESKLGAMIDPNIRLRDSLDASSFKKGQALPALTLSITTSSSDNVPHFDIRRTLAVSNHAYALRDTETYQNHAKTLGNILQATEKEPITGINQAARKLTHFIISEHCQKERIPLLGRNLKNNDVSFEIARTLRSAKGQPKWQSRTNQWQIVAHMTGDPLLTPDELRQVYETNNAKVKNKADLNVFDHGYLAPEITGSAIISDGTDAIRQAHLSQQTERRPNPRN